MKLLLVSILAALAVAPAANAASFSTKTLSDIHVGTSKTELVAQRDHSQDVIEFFAKHHWMRAPRHSTCWSVPWSHTCIRAREIARAHLWLHRLAEHRLAVLYPPAPTLDQSLVADFLCIHKYEGAWTSNTGNGYYGGVQMDSSFMRSYGAEYVDRWGTADNWPVWAQIDAAIRAHNSGRGFTPWPNTARACGLL